MSSFSWLSMAYKISDVSRLNYMLIYPNWKSYSLRKELYKLNLAQRFGLHAGPRVKTNK